MGADLYLMSLNKKVQEKYEPLFNKAVKERDLISDENEERKKDAQKKVSKYYDLMYSKGYFRDSYNAWSLLWQYDLSWWDDFGKLLNKSSNLTPKKAEKLLAILEDRKQIFFDNLNKINDGTNKVWNEEFFNNKKETTDEKKQEIIDYFLKKAIEFKKFLKLSIKLNESIHCSI